MLSVITKGIEAGRDKNSVIARFLWNAGNLRTPTNRYDDRAVFQCPKIAAPLSSSQ